MSGEIEIVKRLNKDDSTQCCKSALCHLYLRDVVGERSYIARHAGQ
jgi:hypothetical protein